MTENYKFLSAKCKDILGSHGPTLEYVIEKAIEENKKPRIESDDAFGYAKAVVHRQGFEEGAKAVMRYLNNYASKE